ncbi:hypothetical protein UFOVP1439_43 [uncultured Caudovirales phage]|jgi:hypothetical protein|uniref:Uncharacterized protein n=1 Tax=uncultured Caudovirales phage TaxID=2100421 RepID=A0A6J5SGV0_9CAUD|nr:hypothetical protein UFOVP1085_23 [uncultured Caudovirales phage]CAB4212831.1 hypothetical protein UFOVP1439_43 [uncultured Caudovirales phage]
MTATIDPTSVVIVRWPKGFVAHVRFADVTYDIDMSSHNKNYLYEAIERYWKKINE